MNMNKKAALPIVTFLSVCLLQSSAFAGGNTQAGPTVTGDPATTSAAPEQQSTFGKVKEGMGELGTTASIKTQFAQDDIVSMFDISVTTEGNKVILEGTVDTDMQYERAMTIAHQAKGVEKVDASLLTVRQSKSPKADLDITAQAKAKLHQLPFFKNKAPSAWNVNLETKNRVLYIEGTVNSEQMQDQILEQLESIQNVEDIESDLRIQ